jgi:ATP-dependent HslUV protease, peptidase subunit HslV
VLVSVARLQPLLLNPQRPALASSIAVYTVAAAERGGFQWGAKSRISTLRYTEISIRMKQKIRSTTVLCVRRDGKVVMAGDGQVTLGSEVLKSGAKKLRRLYNDKIVAGFAGSTADAFSLFARFETKLEQFNGNLSRSVVELAKEWRTDKILRHLEALLLVADVKNTYILSGNGDVIEPDENVAAIGSGGAFALSAATALLRHTKMNSRQIVEEAMKIAGKICIYTNDSFTFEEVA